MTNSQSLSGPTRKLVIALQKGILILARHWTLPAMLVIITIPGLAFLASAFMASDQPAAGQAVYRFLAPHDHQLPQRSYFLFSERGGVQTYSRAQIIGWGGEPGNLRAFVGNGEIGYKLGLNQRMIAIFLAMVLGGLIWQLRGGQPHLRFPWLLLLALPLLIDGLSHMDSDATTGYRLINAWAVTLTGGLFSEEFYAGTTLGTLNWWLRTLTGALFGLGLVWYLFSYFSIRFAAIRRELEPKLRKAGLVK